MYVYGFDREKESKTWVFESAKSFSKNDICKKIKITLIELNKYLIMK